MILDKFGYRDFSFVSTSFDSSAQLMKNTDNSVNRKRYIQIIRSLMYLTSRTKLTIAYVISKLSRYTSNPNIIH